MAILMMVVLVGLMLSSLLVPMIITQDRTTRFDTTRVQALDAAQSGIDVALGIVRAGVTNGIGDMTKLPCGNLSGSVNGSSAAAYSVTVEYFTFDPGQAKNPQSTPPEAEPYPSANAMRCSPGSGTYNSSNVATTPSYARFTSVGTVGTAVNGSTAGRTLTSTYVLRTSNVAVPGGFIQVSASSSPPLCIDAGSPPAASGTGVSVSTCIISSPPIGQQAFSFRPDLTLQLLSSISTNYPKGLCLTVSGDAVQLSECLSLGSPAYYTQQWTYDYGGRYQAAQSNSSTTGNLPDLCMNIDGSSPGVPVKLRSCSGATTWLPSNSIGTGADGSIQRLGNAAQLVNYSESGRCLDVAGQDPNSGSMIDYPCKQNPFPAAITWNQLFQVPAIPAGSASVAGQITTYDTDNGQTYCLTNPGTVGGNVTVRSCTGGTLQNWTIYGGNASLNYSTKYTVVSGSWCLGLMPVTPWSIIDVENCTGATTQKWNAAATVLASTLKRTYER